MPLKIPIASAIRTLRSLPARMRLRFSDPDTEKTFRQYHDYTTRRFNRLGCALSIIVWAGIYLVVYLYLPDIFFASYHIIVLVVYPVLIIVLGLSYVRRLTWAYQWLSAGANLVTAVTLLALSYIFYMNEVFLTCGMALMSIYAFFLFRLRFRVAATVSWAYMIAFQVLLIVHNQDQFQFIVQSSAIAGTQLACMAGGYFTEKANRALFISTSQLRVRNNEIEGDLEIARLIIDNVLTRGVDASPRFRIHDLYLPMDKVGGDFFDVVHRDGVLDFLVADVSGHGLASSYLALVTKMVLEKSRGAAGPAEVLSRLNGELCRATVRNNYVTAFCGRLDGRAGTMTYSSAGHPPAFLRRQAGGTVPLKTRGKPLGWFLSSNYEEAAIDVYSGDRLVLYTDGVIECADRTGALFGEERFIELIDRHGSGSPEDFTRALMAAIRAFAGGEDYGDDITVLVIDVL